MEIRAVLRVLLLTMYLCYAKAAQLQKAFFPADARTQTMTFGTLSTTLRLRDHDVKSKPLKEDARRIKRYVLSKRKWPYEVLAWKLEDNNIRRADRFIIRNTLHRAFNVWSSVSALRFVEVPDGEKWQPDITIAFLKGSHGDGLAFDGPEGIVAHAFYPTYGILHFDADENWTLNGKGGIDLYQTAVHEIGHLLGLEHSTDDRAVMFPRNRQFDIDFGLADDDVRGIRRLYPPRVQKKTNILP